MTPRRRLARLIGLLALWQTINVLERMVYAAGVEDARDRASAVEKIGCSQACSEMHRFDETCGWGGARDQADELEPADVSDVVEAHAECCGTPA